IALPNRKSVVKGKRVDLGGRRIIKKKGTEGLAAAPIAPKDSTAQRRTSRSVSSSPPSFSSRRRHTRLVSDWSSDVCSSDLIALATIHRVDILISWNFKHIVNVNRIRG